MNKKDEKELLKDAEPCPFCGNVKLETVPDSWNHVAVREHSICCKDDLVDSSIYCDICDITGPVGCSPREAIERWNERNKK